MIKADKQFTSGIFSFSNVFFLLAAAVVVICAIRVRSRFDEVSFCLPRTKCCNQFFLAFHVHIEYTENDD